MLSAAELRSRLEVLQDKFVELEKDIESLNDKLLDNPEHTQGIKAQITRQSFEIGRLAGELMKLRDECLYHASES